MGESRRIAAYGVCRDSRGAVLLARGSSTADLPAVWQLPGGGIDHGEHPADGVIREFGEETGLTVAVTGLRAVVSDVLWGRHTDRVIYDVAVRGGTLRAEPDGTTDLAEWIAPAELTGLSLMPFTAELLGLPPTPVTTPPPAHFAVPPVEARPTRGQRFAAYGVATDPAGRLLLTVIAEGYPGAGLWHLPGGGTDHGEQPVAALLRELAEETNQVGRVTDLLDVTHLHRPRALGPEGYPIDWHTVRAIYRVHVDAPTEPRVTEAAGGSTAGVAWFAPAEVAELPLTDVAASAVSHVSAGLGNRG
ncbi:NUDIX hydrolase [Phytohabitans kaempferiae]|uniref:NUDIX hydrolase n=1 Tax=Phytohabitans kaempferiae TaxID=1620943 RepID=A0ABV6LVC9_9ACTN